MNDIHAGAVRPPVAARVLAPLAAALCLTAFAQTPPALADLPLVQPAPPPFARAFRPPTSDFGASTIDYAEGPIALGPDGATLYVVGHAHHQAIAEFTIPPLGTGPAPADLPMAQAPRQPFVTVLDRTTGGNPQALDRIGGSPVDGPYAFEGGAGHTAGWLAPIPDGHRDALGGDHLTGHSSGIPIISRASVGPSAFAFGAVAFDAPPGPIPTTRLLDFDLAHPLHGDLDADGDNPLWTHLSRATVGLIVPGSRTYLDLVAVREGRLAPHDVRPYAYGPLDLPHLGPERRIGGGTYDAERDLLYLTALGADDSQGPYAYAPLVLALRVAGGGAPR